MTLRYNLLDEPLIRTRLVAGGQPYSFSLTGLLVALSQDAVRDFPALRPHQRHPWHAFLVQLATLALHQADRTELFEDEAGWKEALMALTPNHPDGSAWCLIAPPDQPAFMQAPVPGGNVNDWTNDRPTPDSLDDVLVTSRNHDLKPARISLAQVDDWIFALTSLQTQGPCPGGAGKIYGITRMNGGASSRPGLGLVVPGWFGNRWKRDVRVAIKSRQKIVEDHGFLPSGGIGLLWTIPWAGSESESIPFPSLDPYFIEVCRRVRLVDNNARISAIRATSKMRIVKSQADKLHGNTGDLWTPIDIKNINEPKSLGVSESGFSYNKMADLAFGPDYIRPPTQEIQPSDPKSGLFLLARAIGGGQSKTAGYHERRIPITKNVRLLLQGNIDQLAAISRKRIQVIAMVARILKISLETLFDGGRQREKNFNFPKGVEQKASKYVRVFDQGEDALFFDDLIVEIESPDQDDIFPQWQRQLLSRADKILGGAFSTGPQSGEQRYRARSIALEKFRTLVRDKYPDFANYYRQ